MEHICRAIINNLQGKYYSLPGITDEQKEHLESLDFFLNKPKDPVMRSAGITRDWPASRAIWHSEDSKLHIWVNEEDHLRITSIGKDGDILTAFTKYCDVLQKVNGLLFSFYIKLRFRIPSFEV